MVDFWFAFVLKSNTFLGYEIEVYESEKERARPADARAHHVQAFGHVEAHTQSGFAVC